MACYERARLLSSTPSSREKQFVGVGCTASLASDRPKLGDHRVHVAIQTACSTSFASVRLIKGTRTRSEEDELASQLILHFLKSEIHRESFSGTSGGGEESVASKRFEAPQGWINLLAGSCSWASGNDSVTSGQQISCSDSKTAVYSGAFHPRHEGHQQIARYAATKFDRIIHEISIRNVEKPPLDFYELSERAAQFAPHEEIVFTCAATFVEKARVFPSCTFIVGVDTIRRISQPKFYGGENERNAAIAELASLCTRFLVFGRNVGGTFCEFQSSEIDPALAKLCDGVAERDFRLDISSTDLRAKGEL